MVHPAPGRTGTNVWGNGVDADLAARGINVRPTPTNGVGTGDDTAYIQAYLDQVSPALGVVDVFIHDGVWMINGVKENLANTNNQWIEGGIHPKSGTRLHMTPGAVLKVIPNASPGYAVVYLGLGHDDVKIDGGSILGDRATHDYTTEPTYTTHEWGHGVVTRCKNITLDNVAISGCTGDSLSVMADGMLGPVYGPYNPTERLTVRNCHFDGARRNNISITASVQVLIENCRITNAGTDDGIHAGILPKYGIDIEGYGEGSFDYETPLKVTVRGNHFEGNALGSVMNFTGYNVVIDGNYSDNTISYGYGTESVITNNVFQAVGDTTKIAISSNSGSTYPANAVIADNVIVGFGTGIQASNEGVIVSGNYVTGFATNGISAYMATNASIYNNRIANGANGTGAAVALMISTCTTVHAHGNAIYNTATGVTVGGSSTGITIADNSITKAQLGLSIAANCSVVVKGNVTKLTGHALGQSYDLSYTGAGTTDVLCEDNTFRGSTTYSIVAVGSATVRSRILRNKFIDSASSCAISCSGAGGAHEIIDNEIAFNRSGGVTGAILVVGGVGSRIIGNTVYNVGTGAVSPAITTSGSGTTKIARNIIPTGATPISCAATDTLTDNTVVGGDVLSAAADRSVLVTDRTLLGTGGASGITFTLPAVMAGLRYVFKKVDAAVGTVTIATTSAQTIDGAATKVLTAQYDKVSVVSDGVAWFTI